MTIKGDRKAILRVMRQYCYAMDRKARAEFVRRVEEKDLYWITYQRDSRHKRLWGYDNFPIAFACDYAAKRLHRIFVKDGEAVIVCD